MYEKQLHQLSTNPPQMAEEHLGGEGADVLRVKYPRGVLQNNVSWTQDFCTQKLKAPPMVCMNLHKVMDLDIQEWMGGVLRDPTLS